MCTSAGVLDVCGSYLLHLFPVVGQVSYLERRRRWPADMMLPQPQACLSAALLPVGCAPRRRYPAPAHVTGPRIQPIISIKALGKTYASGFHALKSIDLDIRRGEILDRKSTRLNSRH